MLFGRVHGTAICTMKYPGLEGVKLLVVQPLDRHLKPAGTLQVACDVVQAGPGDLCVMVRSREAALAMPDVKFVPVDLALVGIVDDLEVRPDGAFDFTLREGWVRYT
ncbi:MAG: EutN/CcmL family microcompartment protein [Anaerolineales bacterium]|jgi:ethanolamine utilization protein EutN|nr:EutN/CcmL family microcompartment protein [Anaerolineales bacterium]